jgi:hypothetical protein
VWCDCAFEMSELWRAAECGGASGSPEQENDYDGRGGEEREQAGVRSCKRNTSGFELREP